VGHHAPLPSRFSYNFFLQLLLRAFADLIFMSSCTPSAPLAPTRVRRRSNDLSDHRDDFLKKFLEKSVRSTPPSCPNPQEQPTRGRDHTKEQK
jgi:hypothetical protein